MTQGAKAVATDPDPDRNIDVDYWRQLDVFAPSKWKKPVHVIGVGATGSYITFLLAKMGVKDITVYDPDTVETHNLPNQTFSLAAVGKLKVEALAEQIKKHAAIDLKTVQAKATGAERFRGVVFVLTDTMESRKAIWDKALKYNLNVDLVIETRMAVDGGRVYAVRPAIPKEIAAYENTLYPDSEAEESPCTRRAISPTVAVIAGLAVNILVRFANDASFPSETLLSLAPPALFTKGF